MAVFRVERTNNYTVMSNYHLRDKTLSLKAKGLLSLMLSLPETWDYTLSGLARISLEGKNAIRAAVVEPEKAGYIQRGQTTDKAGKFSGNEYIIQEYPYDAAQLDEMVELMVEAVCSRKETIRVAGNDFPQAVVKSRLLKLDEQHIQFVFDCLRENTTQVRDVKQYLLTVLFNAPVTMESHYAAQVNHDLYRGEVA